MSEGRKPLTGAQQQAVWKMARAHGLMFLDQGSQKFDEALFVFAANAADLLSPAQEEIADELEHERMRRALHDIAEEWDGAECGEPVHSQEAYAIGLARRMYELAAEALMPIEKDAV